MQRLSSLRWVFALTALLILSDQAGEVALAADNVKPPNFILCMADDQGWGDVGYYGNPIPQTPVLDEMAATGLRFDRFYSAAPVCSPTRGSVLTGRHPNRFGCFSWGHTLRPQEITVAEALKTAGYTTGHFGKWHLGPVRAESPVCPGNSGFDDWFSSPNFFENNPLMSARGKVVAAKGESSQVTVDAALNFIRAAVKRKQPFLAVVWFGSPHTPHIATEEFRKRYKDLPPKAQNYYGEISGIDNAVGHLRRALRELDVADETLLWYTSDNGSRLPGSTGGLKGQKGSLWEGGIRVPTIIEWPARIPSPRQTDIPSGTVDIYPTLLELAGVKVADQPQPLDGVSLVSLIDGKMKRRSKPLGFWVHPARGRPVRSTQLLEALRKEQTTGTKSPADTNGAPDPAQLSRRYSESSLPGHAVWMEGNFKLHRRPAGSGGFRYSLFDLASDIEEKTDLAETQTARVKKMQAALSSWQKSVIRSLNGEDYPGSKPSGK